MQVAGQHFLSLLRKMATGARVSNAYPTCPSPRDNPVKTGLIPYVVIYAHVYMTKGLAVKDGEGAEEVVGGVTAHLAIDR